MSQEEIIKKLNRLTAREREVFEGFCFDLRYWEIGERLHISEDTVAVHMHIIRRKLNLPEGLTSYQQKKLLLDEYCTHLVPSLLAPAPPDEEDIEVISEDQLEEAKQLDNPPVVWEGETREREEVWEGETVDPFAAPPQTPQPRWRGLVGPAVGLIVGGLVIAALFRFGILGGGGPTEEPPPAGDDAVAIAVALTQTQAAITQGQPPATPEPQSEVQEPAGVPPTPAPAAVSQSGQPSAVCTGSGSVPPIPEAPLEGCVLIVEWWVPPDPLPCGIIMTHGPPSFPGEAIGTWWYVYPNRPDSHLAEFQEKNPHCQVDDVRLTSLQGGGDEETSTSTKPTTAQEAAAIFGGPDANQWQSCPQEPVGCWTFVLPGSSYRVSVPENCLRSDGSIDGWRNGGGYPEAPTSLDGTTATWEGLEAATIRCS